MLALIPAGVELPALATIGLIAAALILLLAYENVKFAELRERLRHQLATD